MSELIRKSGLAEAHAQVLCGDCDGVGWVEGGPTIATSCKTCSGRGATCCDQQHDAPIHDLGDPCAACGVNRGVHLAYLLAGDPHYFCDGCKADCTAMMGTW